MIITRTPLRITLGGGGTDLESYYSRYGGYVITSSIDKYVYVAVNRMFEDKIRLSYSKTEVVESIQEIQHPVVREMLRHLRLKRNLEIVSIADLPSNTGLGSSGSFTVGLLNSLLIFKKESNGSRKLAEGACKILMEILKEPEGKQDPYIAAFGGLISITINRSGTVEVRRIRIRDDFLTELQSSLVFFYTGIKRSSAPLLNEQQDGVRMNKEEVVESLHHIKSIGYKVRSALERGDTIEFGKLLHEHWVSKKKLSIRITNDYINRWYELGVRAGAIGGKISGAGGGGFLVFCCPGSKRELRRIMQREGLREVQATLGVDGSKAILNIRDSSHR